MFTILSNAKVRDRNWRPLTMHAIVLSPQQAELETSRIQPISIPELVKTTIGHSIAAGAFIDDCRPHHTSDTIVRRYAVGREGSVDILLKDYNQLQSFLRDLLLDTFMGKETILSIGGKKQSRRNIHATIHRRTGEYVFLTALASSDKSQVVRHSRKPVPLLVKLRKIREIALRQ